MSKFVKCQQACALLAISFCIDYVPVSFEDQQSPVTNSLSSLNNTISPSWLPEALKEIAYYLRAHKFNEYDRRYEPDAGKARREYYSEFPRPPLRSLHWEVHKFCEQSFLECVDYLRKRVRRAGLKRADDTAVVIQEQQWNQHNNSQQIGIVDKECKKLRDSDNVQADPFEGPLERFQWRVTASYYLCWYSMKSEPSLAHLSDNCDNFANCLDLDLGPNNGDYRANDANPFACALYSFCPDPCCPIKHLKEPGKCWNSPDNPCFEENPPGQRQCLMNRSQNTEFRDLILNRWNTSCTCPKQGFKWSSFFGLCVDIDECALGTSKCDPENEICLNLPGSYKCVCKWGHAFEENSCKASPALAHLVLGYKEKIVQQENRTLWRKFFRLFQRSSGQQPVLEIHLIVVANCLRYYRFQLL